MKKVKPFLCRVADIASLGWDWIDKRQIDCWVVSIFTLSVSYRIGSWAMGFAEHSDREGMEVAAIITAVGGPWTILQAAVVKFVFDARKGSFTRDQN